MIGAETNADGDETASVVPLIEVLLVINLFFVVTYSAAGQIPVPLPPGPGVSRAANDSVRVTVRRDGAIAIGGETYTARGLVDELRRRRASTVLIYGDKQVALEHVVAVWKLCLEAGVRAMAQGVENP